MRKSLRRAVALAIAAVAAPVLVSTLTPAGASSWTAIKLPAGTGSEPGIDIGFDANGDELIYVHGTFGLPGHNRAWINQPDLPGYGGGAFFKQLTFNNNTNRLPGGGDADIAFRGDEIWFIDLWLGSNSVQYSPDKGQNWTLGTPFSTLPLSDRQWIALGGKHPNPVTGELQTTVYVLYQTVQLGDGLWLSRSRDNGLTWDFHTPIPGLPGVLNGIPAHIVSDGGDTVAVAANAAGEFRVAVSEDAGESWNVSSVSGGYKDANGWATGFSMNPEDPNEMAITYPASSGIRDFMTFNKVVVRTSTDGGETWGDAIRMQPNPPALTSIDWFPWVDYRGDKIAVTWYQSTEYWAGRAPDDAKASNRWHVYYSESLDDGATFSLPEQVTTYTTGAKTGAICTQGLNCTGDRQLGDFMQIAIDRHGKSWIVMVHANGGPSGAGIYAYRQD